MIEIDVEMRDIVDGLNSLGLITRFSCQGNHEDGQIGIAYICFSEGVSLPESLLTFAKNQNWQLDCDDSESCQGLTYSIHSVESDFPENIPELIKRNVAFINGWRYYIKSKI